jgi:hypothetical protein
MNPVFPSSSIDIHILLLRMHPLRCAAAGRTRSTKHQAKGPPHTQPYARVRFCAVPYPVSPDRLLMWRRNATWDNGGVGKKEVKRSIEQASQACARSNIVDGGFIPVK